MVRSRTRSGRGLPGALPGLFFAFVFLAWPGARASGAVAQSFTEHPTTGGSLVTLNDKGTPRGSCPLQHTDVEVEISGFIARTRVMQRFGNPFEETIEAVYTFPLPDRAAVTEMTLTVGERIIKGKIAPREEARAIYEAARLGGRVSGLLDQERPNIFTQAVANIQPGEQVTVTIGYLEMLEYVDAAYELVFPMVVGPRYIPGQTETEVSHDASGGGWSYDTDEVPDASRITPPMTPPGTRAGHDISITVALDSGVALRSLRSPTHAIAIEQSSAHEALVELKNEKTIPNKDFVLRYAVAGSGIEDAFLAHRNGSDGFFALILEPPAETRRQDVTPKELVFVLDTSGSMSGFPIEKAKETMRLALEGLHRHDTFNLITFAGHTRVLFPAPVPATRKNLDKAQAFLRSRRGGGGTEMMAAIRTALAPSASQEHVRIVCFMTDGYVGNDMAILAEIKQHPNARVFAFGIGSSVNRFLLDRMAAVGRGEVAYVGLGEDGSSAAKRFHERVRSPLLTDITINWGDLDVRETFPKRIPDLFDAKPLIISGRYMRPGTSIVRVAGQANGKRITREIVVDLPVVESRHSAVANLWARRKVSDLMGQDFGGIQRGAPKAEVKEAIVRLGLEHELVTQFTSFVAVEELIVTAGGKLRRIDVPVEMPAGVSYEMLGFGPGGSPRHSYRQASKSPMPPPGALAVRPRSIRPPAVLAAEMADTSGSRELANPQRKLDSDLRTLIDRPSDSAASVKDGKVEIRVWLSDTSAQALAELERSGFEMLHRLQQHPLVIGRISIDQLEALAGLKVVRFIGRVIGS